MFVWRSLLLRIEVFIFGFELIGGYVFRIFLLFIFDFVFEERFEL